MKLYQLKEFMKTKLMALEALKRTRSELWQKIATQHSPEIATHYPEVQLADAAIAALEADIAKPLTPHGWMVSGVTRVYFGEHAEMDAMQEARQCGGTAKAYKIYTTPQEPAAPQAITKALEDAATSLETISILAGRATYGNPPIESCMGEHIEVRAYAKARADVARQSLAAPVGAPSCP